MAVSRYIHVMIPVYLTSSIRSLSTSCLTRYNRKTFCTDRSKGDFTIRWKYKYLRLINAFFILIRLDKMFQLRIIPYPLIVFFVTNHQLYRRELYYRECAALRHSTPVYPLVSCSLSLSISRCLLLLFGINCQCRRQANSSVKYARCVPGRCSEAA